MWIAAVTDIIKLKRKNIKEDLQTMGNIIEMIDKATGFMWGPVALIALLAIGMYFTFGTKFLQIRKFSYVFKNTLGKSFKDDGGVKGEGTLTPRQSISTALASTVGMGNIVGVASALVFGGPGAIFWMWVSAFIGMIIKYAEIILCIKYREKNENGEFVGGPALYIKNGLNIKFVGGFITVLMAIVCICSNMVQSNVIIHATNDLIPGGEISHYLLGGVLVVLVAIVAIGGVTRVGKVAERIVPLMAIVYIIGGLVVLLSNFTEIPAAISMIFSGAFKPLSVGGGVAGYGVMLATRYGFSRGFFSSGAGQAVFTVSHSPAIVENPVQQAIWGIMEVFIDTIVLCTMTALVILTSGILTPASNPALLTAMAFGETFGIMKNLVNFSIILFAYTSVIGIGYVGESQLSCIMSSSSARIFRYIYLVFTFIGAIGGLQIIWNLTDFFLGIVMAINLTVLVVMSPQIFKITKEYFSKPEIKKAGNN